MADPPVYELVDPNGNVVGEFKQVSGETVVENQENDTVRIPSLRTEDINSIRSASAFDGDAGSDKITAAINDLPSEGGAVVVSPDGPDDLSGYADAEYANGWLFTDVVTIPSNVSIILVSSYAFLDTETNNNFFRNVNADSGDSTRDENISLIGLGSAWLDGNETNQTRQSNEVFNCGITFHKVDSLRIEGLKLGPFTTFAILPENVTDVHISDIELNQVGDTSNSDGCHLIGPAERVVVSSVTGDCADDVCVVNSAADGSFTHWWGDGGDIANVIYTDVTFRKRGAAGGIRTIPGNGHTMERVVFEDIKQTDPSSNNNMIKLGYDGVATDALPEEHQDITIRGVTAETSNDFMELQQPVKDLTVEDVTATTGGEIITVAGDYDIDGLHIADWDIVHNTDASAIPFDQLNTVSNVTIRECYFRNTSGGSPPGIALVSGTFNDLFRVEDVGMEGYSDEVRVDSAPTLNIRPQYDITAFDGLGRNINQDGVIVSGVAEESANADEPQLSYPVGTHVDFTDSGDGSGTGVYLIRQNGSPVQIN